MSEAPLDIQALPAILAGPIVRRLTRTSVCIWVALSRGDPVTLHIMLGGANEVKTNNMPSTPVQVGSHLWLAALTSASPNGTFAANSVYFYKISSAAWAAEPDWSALALGTGNALPGFPGLPEHFEDLVMLHVSCRKWAGGGGDGLALAAGIIQERLDAFVSPPNPRPHLLIQSGDQIYADEVPTPLVPRIRRLAADLVGIDQPIDQPNLFELSALLGGRQEASASFGLTSSEARDHLWTISEFYAAYLLAWSDQLWPSDFPLWKDIDKGEIDHRANLEETWDDMVARLKLYKAGIRQVRKVLANVPSLMLFDDHEITDDWNFNHDWVSNVYRNVQGRQVIANGLLAYNLFQHWGNVPDRFSTPGTAEHAVLAAAAFPGPTTAAERVALENSLGFPEGISPGLPVPPPPLPQVQLPLPVPLVLRNRSAPGAIAYDFMVGPAEGYPLRIAFLDERTVREYPTADGPAGRIALAALPVMVPPATTPALPVTIVVAPSPVFGTHVVERVLQPASSIVAEGALFTDYESWPGMPRHHQELLQLLAAIAPVVVFSGDVHYGAVSKASFTIDGKTSRFAQLICSAAKNADIKTMTLHQLGDLSTLLGIERPRRFVGFNGLTPPQREKLNAFPELPVSLPYDDIAELACGRVRVAGAETPAVFSAEMAAAYGFEQPAWEYTVEPVDNQALPSVPLAMEGALTLPLWKGWDPDKSFTMVQALRASDLHRIGRVFVGLSQVALVHFTAGPLTVHQSLFCHVGATKTSAELRIDTQVVLE